jgi:hypothetical protein
MSDTGPIWPPAAGPIWPAAPTAPKPTPQPQPAPKRKSHKWPVACGLVGLGVLIAAGIGAAGSPPSHPATAAAATATTSAPPAATTSAPAATTTVDPDSQYVADLTNADSYFGSVNRTALIALGRGVCSWFAEGDSVQTIDSTLINSNETAGTPLSSTQLGYIVGAAVADLCPAYGNQISQS